MVDSNQNSWRLFPSKRFPGAFYYFNTVNGETVWRTKDAETKCTSKDCTHNMSQNFQFYPEPNTPPDTQQTPHTSNICNRIAPVFFNYPYNPFIYHNSPHMWGPQPYFPNYYPNCQEFNPCHWRPEAPNKKVYKDQFVQTNISNEKEEKKETKSQCCQISPKDLAELNSKDEIFKLELLPEEKALTLDKKPEESEQVQCAKEYKDLRLLLKDRLKINSNVKIGDSKSTQNITNPDQKHVTFRLENERESNSAFSSDSVFYRDTVTKPDNPKPVSVHFLRTLKGSKTEKIWYIVVDTEILIDDFDFIFYFVRTDNNCRLFIPHVVYSELQATSKGKSRGRNATIAARQTLRKIEMDTSVIEIESELKKELYAMSSADSILNSCLEVMNRKYHVVLVTNNRQLHKKAKTISVDCYMLKELDNEGYGMVAEREKTFERTELEVEKSSQNARNDFPESVGHLENNLKIVMQDYICTFTQVIEDALGNILLASNKTFKLNPPWMLYEAILCVKELYEDDDEIANMVEQFSSYLIVNSSKDGQICNYAPGDLIKVIGYGVALLHYLREKKNQDCLAEAEGILRRILTELNGSRRDFAMDVQSQVQKMKNGKETSRGRDNIIRVFGRDLDKVKISNENYLGYDTVYSCAQKKTNNLINVANVNSSADDNQAEKANRFNNKMNQQRNEVASNVSSKPKFIRNLKPINAFEEKLKGSGNVFHTAMNNDETGAVDKQNTFKMLDAIVETKINFAKEIKGVETFNAHKGVVFEKEKARVPNFIKRNDVESGRMAINFSSLQVMNEPKVIRNIEAIDGYEEKLMIAQVKKENIYESSNVKACIVEKENCYDVTKSNDNCESNVDVSSDDDSFQAYLFMRSFLTQLNHSFKIIHCFVTETLSEWTEIQSDEVRTNETSYRSVTMLKNLLKILDFLRSLVERESKEDTSVKRIILKAGYRALNDKRVTNYKQVIMKCSEQGHILKRALKETMKLIYNETKSETDSSIVYGHINIYE